MNTDQIHTYRTNGVSYAIVSEGGPHCLGSHTVLMKEGETAEQALTRAAKEYTDKAVRLLRWAKRIETALERRNAPEPDPESLLTPDGRLTEAGRIFRQTRVQSEAGKEVQKFLGIGD